MNNYPNEFNDELKEKIKSRDGHKCILCTDSKKQRKLVVHHLDYGKNNNSEDNLLTLCLEHHGRTNFGDRRVWMRFLKMLIKIRNEKGGEEDGRESTDAGD